MISSYTYFNARKAAQVAAFFALQEDGFINVLKLTKLIYISDRVHMEQYDYPILNDKFVAMPHGPVNSMTYEFINGDQDDCGWNEFITDREGHNVGLTNAITLDDLDELSEAEISTLHKVWSQFGSMGQYTIRDWTHQNCPEWEDPHGSSNPIPYARVFKFLGKKNAELLEEKINESSGFAEIFYR
ncbi:MAG: SocA family protein [Chlorobiaceae bacterium]|nr:SocA family protein [Chlorobiaceae bacterium]